jgi:hypothetical protein
LPNKLWSNSWGHFGHCSSFGTETGGMNLLGENLQEGQTFSLPRMHQPWALIHLVKSCFDVVSLWASLLQMLQMIMQILLILNMVSSV